MMKVNIAASDGQLRLSTSLLQHRIHSSLLGLSSTFGFVQRSMLEPKISVAAGYMTGVDGSKESRLPVTHHISGTGTSYEETVISILAETIERYALYVSSGNEFHKVVSATYQNMVNHCRVLIAENLQYFSENQLFKPGFPFSSLSPDAVIGWVATKSLIDSSICWVPAQIVLVNYLRQDNEPKFMLGVSTGTAAHTSVNQALKNALLELVQIDAAMGNWYGKQSPILLNLEDNARTETVKTLIKRHLCRYGPIPRFYWLPNPDLPALTIACVIEDQQIPKYSVGLGCDLSLSRAIYKAFLEGVAVAKLAKVNVLSQPMQGEINTFDPDKIYDLDTNVAYYATDGETRLRIKFSSDLVMSPDELPSDVALDINTDLCYLINGFKEARKELVFLDLTTPDVRDLGFYVVRVWSPDTISLSLPSAPPIMHSRFQDYGGVTNESPHPYP